MSDSELSTTKKQKRRVKKSTKISFDDEIVPKTLAKPIKIQNSLAINEDAKVERKKPSKVSQLETVPKQPKKLKRKENSKLSNDPETNVTTELDPANPKIEKDVSKRAIKRKKHEQLMLEKKLKVDLVMQEKCLNYLSKWKHSRDDWKFEKLRQVWLQQNVFDVDKVPDQFWETLLEYFCGSRGKIRETILQDAVKIIENEDSEDNKIQRAKDVVQRLQE